MAVLRKLLQLILLLVVLQLGRLQSESWTSPGQEHQKLTQRVEALEGDVEGVKNSTLAIMDILVAMKEDLAALRKDTQDVMGELATVREDTKSMSQNTESSLKNITTDLAMLQNITTDLAMLKQDTNATLQDITTDLAMLKQDTNATLQDITTDLAMLKQDTNSVLRELQVELTSCLRQNISVVDPQVSIQYLPTSCDEIAELNPKSPLGFYWIHSMTNFYGIQVLCTSPQTPVLSCEHIATHYTHTSSGYYWVESSNGSAVNVYCDNHLTLPDEPSPSCQDIVKMHQSAPSGYYWVESFNGSAVNVYCSSPQDPALSCQYIAETHPSAPSGYYWVRSSNGSAVNVYCDMARHCCGSTGGWMRVAYLDLTDTSQQCPEGFRQSSEPKRTCELIDPYLCTLIVYPSHHIQYSKVCGKVRAYQYGNTPAFGRYYHGLGITIDSNYVGGMSITHGESPRKHIWTFATARDEIRSNSYVCPCTKTDTPYTGRVPPFIGNDYFCDTGSRENAELGRFYSEDPLWDGEGCGPTSSCCQFNSPPWFCKELSQPTPDDVEVRVCRHTPSRNIPFELIELYIQ